MSSTSIFVTRLIPETGLAPLTVAGYRVEVNPNARSLRHDELVVEAGRHDAIICQLSDSIDHAVIEAAAPRCKVIATCAVGHDNIDLAAAEKAGIAICNTPDILTNATADLTWALLLATARRLPEAERLIRARAWRGWGMMDFLGADVHGATLGIIGAGRIGTAVARRAQGFDMRVLYHARSVRPAIEAFGASRASLDELLRTSDYVSMHVPLTEDTHHLLNEAALGKMKRGAILINTARGAVVDQVALVEALSEGRIAAAGLDVYDKEPAVPPELVAMENVVLLPHIGSATTSTRARMAEMAAQNVLAVLKGRDPPNGVALDPEAG